MKSWSESCLSPGWLLKSLNHPLCNWSRFQLRSVSHRNSSLFFFFFYLKAMRCSKVMVVCWKLPSSTEQFFFLYTSPVAHQIAALDSMVIVTGLSRSWVLQLVLRLPPQPIPCCHLTGTSLRENYSFLAIKLSERSPGT